MLPPEPVVSDDISRIGKEIYRNRLRSVVETPENIGKIIAIDVQTGDYDIADDLLKAGARLHATHPGALLWSERIGYDAVYAFGAASIDRTAQ